MARTHARTKGKAGSTKPVNPDVSFVTLKKDEIVKLIVDLAKEGKSNSMIGLTLRDTYGVPSVKVCTGKSISAIVSENKLESEIPEDLKSLVERALKLKKHLEFNKRDVHNKRGYALMTARIRKLEKYYKESGRIPQNWSMN